MKLPLTPEDEAILQSQFPDHSEALRNHLQHSAEGNRISRAKKSGGAVKDAKQRIESLSEQSAVNSYNIY